MKLLIVAGIIAVTTNCYAGQEWTLVDKSSDINSNFQLEIKEASIESISSSTVRALTRFVRTDSTNRRFATFPATVESVEAVIDFDCNKRRYKYLQETRIASSGYRVPMEDKSVPTFTETSATSLWNAAREIACKAEGKLK